MPKQDMHLQFQKWAQEYGPVYSLILGTKTTIVLSSGEAVKELLDKRSAIYSDRQGSRKFIVSYQVLADKMKIITLAKTSSRAVIEW